MPQAAVAFHSSQLSFCWLATAAAGFAGVLLWGVGAEAVYFNHRLSGGFLLAGAVIVSILEAATVCCLVVRSRSCCCRLPHVEQLVAMIDSYRRAVVYALLTVPCFVQLHKYWLPAVPGAALILSAVFYASKHCCDRKVPYDFGKMPTFVRFEEDPCCVAQDIFQLPPEDVHQMTIYQPSWQISDASTSGSCSSVPTLQPPPRTHGAADNLDNSVAAIPPPAPPPRRRQMLKPPLQHQQKTDRLCLISDEEGGGGLNSSG